MGAVKAGLVGARAWGALLVAHSAATRFRSTPILVSTLDNAISTTLRRIPPLIRAEFIGALLRGRGLAPKKQCLRGWMEMAPAGRHALNDGLGWRLRW